MIHLLWMNFHKIGITFATSFTLLAIKVDPPLLLLLKSRQAFLQVFGYIESFSFGCLKLLHNRKLLCLAVILVSSNSANYADCENSKDYDQAAQKNQSPPWHAKT